MSIIATTVRGIGTALGAAARAIPGDAGIGLGIAGALAQLGGDLLAAGLDPVEGLRAMRPPVEAHREVLDSWDAALRSRYGAGLDPYGDDR